MKILIIHASAGAGHTRAAQALLQGLEGQRAHQVVLANSLDYTSQFYKKFYQDAYTFFVTKIPWAWGLFCWLTDIPFLQGLVRIVRRIFNTLTARRLADYLMNEKFDYIFSTHFMAHEVACALKREGKIPSKIVVVVTDFDVHRIWLADSVNHYTVATPWTARKLEVLGIPEVKILVSGIPVDKKFFEGKDIYRLKEKLGLEKDTFTVLMATGSFGIGPIESIVAALEDFQLLVVCGRNKTLYDALSARRAKRHYIYGLVNNMDELMAVADAMITKPGGLSISEALVCCLPMIFFSAIPGQETHNIEVLKNYGIGASRLDTEEMVQEIKALSTHPDYLKNQKLKIKNIARPNAVSDILSLIV